MRQKPQSHMGPTQNRYYVDHDRIHYEFEPEFIQKMTKRFPSLTRCDRTTKRKQHVILENNLFEIAVTYGPWSMIVELLLKQQIGRNAGLQMRNMRPFCRGIRDELISMFKTIDMFDANVSQRVDEAYAKTLDGLNLPITPTPDDYSEY